MHLICISGPIDWFVLFWQRNGIDRLVMAHPSEKPVRVGLRASCFRPIFCCFEVGDLKNNNSQENNSCQKTKYVG